MLEVDVLENAERAVVALDPVRGRLLAELARPASAAALAGRLGIARQKVNYHLRTLESHELVQVVEERSWGGLTERLMVASATSYLVSPSAMGQLAPDPARGFDRLSASYLLAVASRAVREVGAMLRRATERGKRLPALSVDTSVRFRSPAERAAFAEEVSRLIAGLCARYHDASAGNGQSYRVVLVGYPAPAAPAHSA